MARRNKAEMNIAETVIVLIIFFILLVFGVIFYAKMQSSSIKEDVKHRGELSALKAQAIMKTLPEVICTKESVEDLDCFDTLKLEAFRDEIKNNRMYYSSLFTNTNITVIKVYPLNELKTWDIYNDMPDNINKTKGGSIITFYIPVTLFEPVSDKNSLGYLKIDVYSPKLNILTLTTFAISNKV